MDSPTKGNAVSASKPAFEPFKDASVYSTDVHVLVEVRSLAETWPAQFEAATPKASQVARSFSASNDPPSAVAKRGDRSRRRRRREPEPS